MGKSRQPYLQELKTVSALLSRQDSWRGFDYKTIYKSVALLSCTYMIYLDDYIRAHAVYGCPVREDAFTELAANKMMTQDKKARAVDIKLAEGILVCRQHPEKFSEDERDCYKRIRLLAEARANYSDVEVGILQQEPYDPETDGYDEKHQLKIYVKKAGSDEAEWFSHGRFLKRPAKLAYMPGVSDETKELHFILTNYHNKYGMTCA